VFPLPSAFRTCSGPRCLSAHGQSHDLRHFSPMPTRCGKSALRDMAHMIVRPINAATLQCFAPSSKRTMFPNHGVLLLCRSTRDSLMTSPVQKRYLGRTSFLNRSSRVEKRGFPRHVRLSFESVYPWLWPCVEWAWINSNVEGERRGVESQSPLTGYQKRPLVLRVQPLQRALSSSHGERRLARSLRMSHWSPCLLARVRLRKPPGVSQRSA
jgi:hypothetical protein